MKKWDLAYYRIRQRCNNKNVESYKNYGGRGIQCLITKEELKKLWIRDRASRLKRPSIDRKNIDENYTFKNCRFIELSKNTGVRRNTTKPNCPQGHPYSGKNLYIKMTYGYRNRICKTCKAVSQKKYEEKYGHS
jgi:hypothetical protein